MNAFVITVSDKGSQNLRVDTAGPAVCELLKSFNYDIIGTTIIPDEFDIIKDTLQAQVDNNINLIVTVGGTGFSLRDVTPEATMAVVERETPGINELMRLESLKITPKAMLSRSRSGIADNSLIVNLPGSKKASVENLDAVLPILEHGIKILLGSANECGNN